MNDYLAILLVSVIAYLIGGIWYSKYLFGDKWVALSKFKIGGKPKAKDMIIGFLSTLVMIAVLNYILVITNFQGIVLGIILGAGLWLGFVASIGIGVVIYERKPFELFLINSLHYLLVLAISGGLLSVL